MRVIITTELQLDISGDANVRSHDLTLILGLIQDGLGSCNISLNIAAIPSTVNT